MHWCLLSIVGVTIIGALLRHFIRKLTTNENVILHADEFIGNLGSGVFVMEVGIIGRLYGSYSVPLLLALFTYVFLRLSYFNRLGGFMNPLSFIASYYKNNRNIRFSLLFAASITATQFVALYSGQQLARMIWPFEDQTHIDAAQIVCSTGMSSMHPWYYIAALEAVGVLIAVCIDAATPPALAEVSGALVMTALYFFFTHISGSFFNPIVATAFSFRCVGHTSDWEHLVVYWIGPAVGMVAACELLSGVDKFVGKKDLKKVA